MLGTYDLLDIIQKRAVLFRWTSFIDYEVVYRKDCHSLEVIDFPEERRIDTIVVKEEEEVSSNYEKIKFLCVERNKEILKSKFTPNSDEWKKIQYEFLEKEIKYLLIVLVKRNRHNK